MKTLDFANKMSAIGSHFNKKKHANLTHFKCFELLIGCSLRFKFENATTNGFYV